MAYLAMVLLISWYQPAARGDVPTPTLDMNVNKLITVKPALNYETQVLAPLHQAQVVAARVEVARLAELEQERLRALEIVRESVQPAEVQVTGDCTAWITAAGITDVQNAVTLINWESGCDPTIYNRSGSGACGVAQELPCGKSGCVLGDGACQVRWMNTYVLERYGSWANAVAFHLRNNWY